MKYKVVYEYAIVSSISAVEKLEEKVNEEIEQGWKPMGGVALYDSVACQAMVKEDDDMCHEL